MRKILALIFLLLSIHSFSQEIFIPNAFTPDGDGQNDYFGVFCVEKDSIQFFSMNIFNSNGQCVFKTFDINGKWPGGDEYYSATKPFIYIIEYRTFLSIEVVRKTGFILLIR
jgi:hypothetical protein